MPQASAAVPQQTMLKMTRPVRPCMLGTFFTIDSCGRWNERYMRLPRVQIHCGEEGGGVREF